MLVGVASVRLIHLWRPPGKLSVPVPNRRRAIVGALANTGVVVMLVISGALSILTVRWISDAPVRDAFGDYSQPLGDQPGVLLKAEPFDRGIPEDSIATRILYTTTGLDGSITLATGLVLVPVDASADPLPVILWAHGTTGVDVRCGPSLLADPLGAGAMLFPELPMAQGWAVVAPDYLGLATSEPHPYMVGVPTAQSSLDAVRAARQLESVSLSDDTVVWGHSQGGGTALWIGIEAPGYAPDVPLLGVAAMSPASDLPALIDTLLSGQAGPLFGEYILTGYSGAYDDVDWNHYIRPGARFSQQKLSERCLSEPSVIVSLISLLITEPFTGADLYEGPLYQRLQENVPSSPLGVPLFVGQGDTDPLILPEVQSEFVAALCDSGQVVEYHTYAERDHMGVVSESSPMLPDLLSWTQARFAGESPPESCTTSESLP